MVWGKSSKYIWHVYPSRYAMGGMRHLGMTEEKVLVSSCLLGQADWTAHLNCPR